MTRAVENLTSCPWCNSDSRRPWGRAVRGFESAECLSCGLIYVSNRLNAEATRRYYEHYYSAVHQRDSGLNDLRDRMYQLEFSLIHSLGPGKRVLDVGCSGGQFLNHFKMAGYDCYGVEFGRDAAREAAKKHRVHEGDLLDYAPDSPFDVIVFRGVIEHIPYPRPYLDKAIHLLRSGGYLYITSTPNAGSFCCRLFKEQWNQHEPEAHLMHFSPSHFDGYCAGQGLHKVRQQFFYEETPYCNPEEDILAVARAISLNRQGAPIDFRSPAFYGNMMSLIYRK